MMWVLGVFLGVIVFCVGYKKFLSLKRKKQFFEEFLHFLNTLNTQIGFFQNKLEEVFEKHNYSTEFCIFLKQCKTFILTANKKEFLLFLSSESFFDSSEHKFVVDFFECFGKLDVGSQCDAISKFSFFIKNKLQNENEHFKRKGKLTLSLSALLGIFVFIVIW